MRNLELLNNYSYELPSKTERVLRQLDENIENLIVILLIQVISTSKSTLFVT